LLDDAQLRAHSRPQRGSPLGHARERPQLVREYDEDVGQCIGLGLAERDVVHRRRVDERFPKSRAQPGVVGADDPADFVARRKDRWRWTMMIMVPDFVGADLYEAALARTRAKLGAPPDTLRLETLTEGLSLQTLHIGSYDEGPILAHLHDELMPAEQLDFNGQHHEIYLSNPRKTEPGKLKTILRQPVKAAGADRAATGAWISSSGLRATRWPLTS
jgi:hypothetical protein